MLLSQDYSLSFYLRQSWRDPRLEFTPVDDSKEAQKVKLSQDSWDKLWVPDTFFRNEKRANFHVITVPNTLVRINETGHVWYVNK